MNQYGLICYSKYVELVSTIAYYKYLNGSNDSLCNWVEAEMEVSKIIKNSYAQLNCKITQSAI